ncbi:MAG: helix-turn-helix transcriptional regulator [Bacteroidetes bacterium]|nr:helix-turn-helix transcriptional regulator [Bacteroidota bacterium]
MTNQLFIGKRWGIFLGILPENVVHRHYSLEICIPLPEKKETEHTNSKVEVSNCIIRGNSKHKHQSFSPQLSILISPFSDVGLCYLNKIGNKEVLFCTDSLMENAKTIAICYLRGDFTYSSFIDKIRNLIETQKEDSISIDRIKDRRIVESIKYIQNNYDKVISLKELATLHHLSPSRFLHLFKKETHSSFRKIQIWNKLTSSLKLFQKSMTLTEIAHECGFTDSAHFSRRFKETFGLTPKQLKTATLYNLID